MVVRAGSESLRWRDVVATEALYSERRRVQVSPVRGARSAAAVVADEVEAHIDEDEAMAVSETEPRRKCSAGFSVQIADARRTDEARAQRRRRK